MRILSHDAVRAPHLHNFFVCNMMTRKIITLIFAVAICLTGCTDKGFKVVLSGNETTDPVDTFSYRGYTNLANLLAGKDIDDKAFLKEITSSAAFETHKASMSAMWERYQMSSIDVIRQWSQENLKESPDTVFYPFGGPDFNYLSSFFPECRLAVLVGIEQAGKLPFIDKLSMEHYTEILTSLRTSISSNVGLSFFQTLNMAEDLNSYLQGTLPVVTMFIALHGYEVITINPVMIKDGKLVYTEPDKVFAHTLDKKIGDGFEVLYRKHGEKGARRVCYLNSNLSNEAFSKNGMDKLIGKTFKGKLTFLKAASYLLHQPEFSEVREAILQNSKTILSGPSGMPYEAYDKNKWNFKFFGNYVGPIPLFSTCVQDDLKAAYKSTTPSPINFRFDYHTSSSFTLAEKK